MIRATLTTAAALLALNTPLQAQQLLHDAVSAAMGEAIEDARYLDVLKNYSLPTPDFATEKGLVNSTDFPYPEVQPGSLLEHVLNRNEIRLGWIAVGAPWSVPGPVAGQPVGFSVEYWDIVLDKLNAHYGKEVKPKWVEFTSSSGNNDMYLWLSTNGNLDCENSNLPAPENCYDMIGGAYAINEQRKKVSLITPSYYPIYIAVLRTRAPLKDPGTPVANAEEILAAAANPDAGLIFAALPDTGETVILDGMKKKLGDTFKIALRDPKSNLLQFAETTEAHFVLGTNVRISNTRTKTPEFCSECEIIPGFFQFDGIGFATALPAAK